MHNKIEIEPYWFASLDNLSELARFLINRDGDNSINIIDFLEKPWKWENEWIEYQNEQQGVRNETN